MAMRTISRFAGSAFRLSFLLKYRNEQLVPAAVVISTFFGREKPYLPVAHNFTRQIPCSDDENVKFMRQS
jgi:hypothetical protein